MERNIRLLIWLFIICIILYFISTTTLSNFITAISTSVIAYFTFYLFSETKKLREDQVKQIENLKKESIRPIIKLHLSLSTECLGVDKVYLHIENRGNGLAKNIKFNFLNNLSDTQQYLVNRLNNEPIFIQGVSFLDTQQPIKNFLFKVDDILSEDFDKEKLFNNLIGLNITYVDTANNKYKSEALLNFSQLDSYKEDDQLKVIAENLKSIEERLETSFRNLLDSL